MICHFTILKEYNLRQSEEWDAYKRSNDRVAIKAPSVLWNQYHQFLVSSGNFRVLDLHLESLNYNSETQMYLALLNSCYGHWRVNKSVAFLPSLSDFYSPQSLREEKNIRSMYTYKPSRIVGIGQLYLYYYEPSTQTTYLSLHGSSSLLYECGVESRKLLV